MRPRTLFPILLIVVGFIVLVAQVYTAPTGTIATHLSLVSRAESTPTPTPTPTATPAPTMPPAPLPDEPLLLMTQNSPLPNLIWVNATDTFRRQLTYSDEDENHYAVLSPDGNTILYIQDGLQSIRHQLLDVEGGTPRTIPIYAFNRQWSPDSRYISYEYEPLDGNPLYSYEISTGITRTLAANAFGAMWHPQTHQLYYHEIGEFEDDPEYTIYRINGDGTENNFVYGTIAADERILTILPDGRLVLELRRGSRADIALINPHGSDFTILTSLPGSSRFVNASPFGNALLYEDTANDTIHLTTLSGQPIQTFSPPCDDPYSSCRLNAVTWHPDGNKVAFSWFQVIDSADYDGLLYTLALDGSAPHLLENRDYIYSLYYSPDGHYLAADIASEVVIWDAIAQTVSTTISLPNNNNTDIVGWRPVP